MSRLSVCVLALAGAASAQLSLGGVRCGQLSCQPGEFCSPETDRCAPCADVCNRTHHNFDAGLCEKECQGYIHDLRYLSRSEGSGDSPDYRSVQLQARAALIVSCVALAVLGLFLLLKCLSLFRDHRGKFSMKYLRQKLQPSKNRVKQYPKDLTHHNPHAEMVKPSKHELKLEIRNPEPPKRHQNQPLNVNDLEPRPAGTEKSHGATTPKTISTTISHRHPAEDTTLDYSYDNMALNVTPPPAQASASHNF